MLPFAREKLNFVLSTSEFIYVRELSICVIVYGKLLRCSNIGWNPQLDNQRNPSTLTNIFTFIFVSLFVKLIFIYMLYVKFRNLF